MANEPVMIWSLFVAGEEKGSFSCLWQKYLGIIQATEKGLRRKP